MLDIGWSELFLIGIVALIVIGPEDLPKLFHTLGRFTAKARSMARELGSAMEDAARQSGLDDVKRSVEDIQTVTSKKNLGLDALDRAAKKFEAWEPTLPGRDQPPSPATDMIPDPSAPKAPSPLSDSPSTTQPAQPRRHAVRRSDKKDPQGE